MELPEKRRDLALLDRSVDTVQAFKRTLDPAAVNEMARFRETQARIIHWVREYLVRIGFNMNRDHLVATLNPYNITSGLGLQSVSLQVIRDPRFWGKPRERLLPNQWKAPTIGIFSPDVLPADAKSGVARLPVDRGKVEIIEGISEGGLIIGREETVDGVKRLPARLHPGEKISIYGPSDVVTVCHQSKTPEQILEEVQRGVYACEYGINLDYDEIIEALNEEASRAMIIGGY